MCENTLDSKRTLERHQIGPLCTDIRATQFDRSLICQDFPRLPSLHTGIECYIARSLYVAVMHKLKWLILVTAAFLILVVILDSRLWEPNLNEGVTQEIESLLKQGMSFEEVGTVFEEVPIEPSQLVERKCFSLPSENCKPSTFTAYYPYGRRSLICLHSITVFYMMFDENERLIDFTSEELHTCQ